MAQQMTKEAFKQIYDTWLEPIRRFIYYKTGDASLTDDLVQDVFVKLWENQHKVNQDSVKSYLYKIAQNLSINQFKKRQAAIRFMQKETGNAHDDNKGDEQMEADERDKALQQALARLSEKNRVVLLMHKMEGLSHKEIAERLDISQKAVEKRMHKAMESLRKNLAPNA